jgi:hypothetical protein
MLIVSDLSKIVVVGDAETKSNEAAKEQRQRVRSAPTPTPHSDLAARSVIGDGTKLFVNGKERKIGKKSQYLLDMLTLED